jgi:hypothetical protein
MNDPVHAMKSALVESRIVTALRPFIGMQITSFVYDKMVNSVAVALDEMHASPMNFGIAVDAVDEVISLKRSEANRR